jgi:hypothetical protein
MDRLDFCTFFTIETMVKKKREEFLKANGLTTFESVRHLIYMQYVISKRGHCYDADIAHIKKSETAKLPLVGVRRRLYIMKGEKLVDYVRTKELHPILKREYIITERGQSVLDNYMSLYSRLNKDVDFLLKKVHKDAKGE